MNQAMPEASVQRVTGLAGLLAAALTMIEIPLYFTYSGARPRPTC
ncbi:hypothetical protein [Streptomyces sp. NBC_01142]|nr:hypothetical protein [Streptomyces sp. NBC_01142]